MKAYYLTMSQIAQINGKDLNDDIFFNVVSDINGDKCIVLSDDDLSVLPTAYNWIKNLPIKEFVPNNIVTL